MTKVTPIVQAQLYRYNTATDQFALQNPLVYSFIVQTAEFCYQLVVAAEDHSPLLELNIHPRMNPVFSDNNFIWVTHDESNVPLYSELLKFAKLDQDYYKTFCQCMFETNKKQQFEELNQEDRLLNYSAYQDDDVEMADFVDSSDEESSEEDYQAAKSDAMQDETQAKNSQLAVGFTSDRSYVVRGNKIGVFKQGDQELEFVTAIKNVMTPTKKEAFNPEKVMLHQQDSKLLMLNGKDKSSVYMMDIETGKMDTLSLGDNVNINSMTPSEKYAQLTNQQTLVGISSNALFQVDPRLSERHMVQSTYNPYATDYKFSAVTTTGNGQLALGSSKGEIRFYDRLGLKRAKTLLTGLGDEIIGVDTSLDGKYVLATCKTYILLIKTQVEGESKNAFETSLTKKMPPMKRLQLKPEHVALMKSAVSFTKATFNVGKGDEKSIVTSTGPYLISWNFKRVKAGQLNSYTIKKYSDDVVAESYQFDQKSIIVALKDNVEMVSKVS
jgi:hypothetical protein